MPMNPLGNRTLYDDTVTSQTLTYGTTNNRLTAIGAQSVTSDNNGNTTSIHGMTLAYDVYNRLDSATISSVTTDYAYNGMGERTTKTIGNNTTHYFYGVEQQLLAEYDASGDVSREYVYLNGQPVVMLEHDGSTINKYWIHNDHLGRPLVLTDAAGDAVWQLLDADAFGNAADIDEDPDNDSTNLPFNVRFQGQYFDSETRLHYNYFRDYNPKTGRYIESDPIGLNGGLNTYGYVSQNPVSYTDPTGLFMGPLTPAVATPPGAAAVGIGAASVVIVYAINKGVEAATGTSIGSLAYDAFGPNWDEIQKDVDNKNYHRTCDRRPPPGLNPCEKAKWEYRQALSCSNKRQAWEDRWGNSSTKESHATAMQQVKQRMKNAAENIARNCDPEPKQCE